MTVETCGPYTIVNEIGSSDGSTSYLARGPEGEVALNVFTETDPEVARKRIELQKTAAALSRHVARVLQHGSCEGGEWYSTPAHRRSVEKLLEGRVALSKIWILEILRAITGGALAFKKSSGRAHGNLQPYNILLSGSETIKEAEIVIKDPSLDAAETEPRDLKAIGLTLYQLVRRREVDQESIILPLELSPEWKSVFGKEAGAWLALCNRLLDSNLSTESYNLEQLDRDLVALLPKPPVSKKQLVAVGVVLACAVLVAVIISWRSRYAKIEIATNLPGAAATLSSRGKVLKTFVLRDKPVAIKLRKGRYELRAVYTNGVYQGALTANTSVDLQRPASVTLTFGFGTLRIEGVFVTANGVTNILSSADLKVEPGKQIKYPIVAPGYRPDAAEETLAAGETKRVVRRLERMAANEVRIDIQTTPKALMVEIRGAPGVTREVSPVTTALAAGRYTVSVQFRGEMKTTNVELTAEKAFTDANALHVDFEATELTIVARNEKGIINDAVVTWRDGTNVDSWPAGASRLFPNGKEFTFVANARGHDPATNRFLLDRASMTRTQLLNTILGIVDVRSDPPNGVSFGTNTTQREWATPKRLDLVPGDYTFYATHEDLGTVTWRGTIVRGTTNIVLQYPYGAVRLFANLTNITNIAVSHLLNTNFRPMHSISVLPVGTNRVTAIYVGAGLTNVSDLFVEQSPVGNPRPYQIKFDYATVIFTTNSLPGISVEYDRDGQTIPVGEIRQGEPLTDIAPLGIARTYRFRTSGTQPKTNLQIVKIQSRVMNVTAELQRKFVIPELDMEFIWVEKMPGYVGRTEVTQSQYQKVARKNPSQHPGSMNPVDSVSWTNAWEFCQLLSQHKPAESGFKYTLPTRSQWLAFAADAATNRALAVISFGMTRATTEPVASKPPNQHGLYDVCGNVWEWTAEKLLMGSSFTNAMYKIFQQVTGNPDELQQHDVGFRVILTPGPGLAKNP